MDEALIYESELRNRERQGSTASNCSLPLDSPIRFWTCQVCFAPRTDWKDGVTAVCLECGRTSDTRSWPTRIAKVPDVDECRKEILQWMKDNQISHRELQKRTEMAGSNLHAMINGSRPLGLESIERIFRAMT